MVESKIEGELDRVAGGGGGRLRAVRGNQDAIEQAPSFAEATAVRRAKVEAAEWAGNRPVPLLA